jgi:hypothetical protein
MSPQGARTIAVAQVLQRMNSRLVKLRMVISQDQETGQLDQDESGRSADHTGKWYQNQAGHKGPSGGP